MGCVAHMGEINVYTVLARIQEGIMVINL